MNIIKLLFEFLKIGTFSFGGSFATLPYIYDLSSKMNWFSNTEIVNMITISQITPGPLACNMATYVGFKLNGVIGSIIATVGFIIPAIIFMNIFYKLFYKFKNIKSFSFILKFTRASAFATIIISSLTILKTAFLNEMGNINYKCIILGIFLVFLIKKNKVKIHPIILMTFAGITGAIFNF